MVVPLINSPGVGTHASRMVHFPPRAPSPKKVEGHLFLLDRKLQEGCAVAGVALVGLHETNLKVQSLYWPSGPQPRRHRACRSREEASRLEPRPHGLYSVSCSRRGDAVGIHEQLPRIPEQCDVDYPLPRLGRRGGRTVIAVAWDDVLFPSTDLFARYKQPADAHAFQHPLRPCSAMTRGLAAWREALKEFLDTASRMSERLLIVSERPYPWVTDSLGVWYPSILSMVRMLESSGKLKILYPHQLLSKKMRASGFKLPQEPTTKVSSTEAKLEQKPQKQASFLQSAMRQCLKMAKRSLSNSKPKPSWAAVGPSKDGPTHTVEASEWNTAAWLYALKVELVQLCRLYPGEPHRNVICLAGSSSSMAAMQEVQACPQLADEHLFTKALRVPSAPTLTELALRLRQDVELLPAFVLADRSFQVNLSQPKQLPRTASLAPPPLQLIAGALQMPKLGDVCFPGHAWGLDHEVSQTEMVEALQQLRYSCSESILCGPPRCW